jgi:predicted metal-dependent peptidase
MNEQAHRAMTKARIRLITAHPFFGVLASSLRLIEDSTLNPPTLATNGKFLRYHPDWVNNHTQDVVQAGVAHEVGHCVLQHCTRGAHRDSRWPYAIDYAVNDMLVDCGFTIPPDWVYDPAYHGMTADKIYSLLPPPKPGDKPRFDPHEQVSADEADKLTGEWEIATAQAAAAERSRNQGKLPQTLQRFMDEMTAPKVDWRTVLRRFATERANNDYSWTRPNRRWASLGYILPSLYSEGTRDITAIVDTSGSVDAATLAAFAAEISDIRGSAQPEVTRVMYCDADVNHVDEYYVGDNMAITPHGGGGTDFRPPFIWLNERHIVPSAAVYLTDGYGTFPTEQPPYPVLWVMTTDVRPPWGECVRIEL